MIMTNNNTKRQYRVHRSKINDDIIMQRATLSSPSRCYTTKSNIHTTQQQQQQQQQRQDIIVTPCPIKNHSTYTATTISLRVRKLLCIQHSVCNVPFDVVVSTMLLLFIILIQQNYSTNVPLLTISYVESFSLFVNSHYVIIRNKYINIPNNAIKDMYRQKQQQVCSKLQIQQKHLLYLSSDDWSSFQSMDDDDDEIVYGKQLDKLSYATENDSPEDKVAVGELRSAPTIVRDATPISVPAGSQLELSEETVLGVLSACRMELGTLFGYTAENRGVGITGGVDYIDLDGPTVIIALKGRFWHTRSSVLDRVANYLQQRIPEIVDVQIEDPWQLTDEANDIW